MGENKWIYLNSDFVHKNEARLSIEDRGTMFADGVYEVVRYYNGRAFAMDRHVARLKQSLAGIRLQSASVDGQKIAQASDEVVARNGMVDAKVYWQITRGTAPRAHRFPDAAEPTVLVMAYKVEPTDNVTKPRELRAIFAEDRRWADCWIKSLMLLANVLAKQQAIDAGCDEAILHREQTVTEGTATSVFIVRQGILWTHPTNRAILPGVTRAVVLELAASLGIEIREQAVTVNELRKANEVFLCGTTTEIAAVTHVEDQMIGNGQAGAITCRLHEALKKHIAESCKSQ